MMGNKLPADIGVAVAALLRWSLETSGSENSVNLGVLPEYGDSDEGSAPNGQLALFGVAPSTIGRIAQGLSWGHIRVEDGD